MPHILPNKKSNTHTINPSIRTSSNLELIEHQLSKARKRRRPNTMYKSKEDALRGRILSSSTSEYTGALGGTEGSSQDIYNLPPSQ